MDAECEDSPSFEFAFALELSAGAPDAATRRRREHKMDRLGAKLIHLDAFSAGAPDAALAAGRMKFKAFDLAFELYSRLTLLTHHTFTCRPELASRDSALIN
jgi:hypothetical protein